MSALRFFFAVLSLLVLSSAAAQNAKNRALLIGISQYENISSLRYADADVKKLSQIMTDFGGYNRSDVTVLLNRDATKDRIRREFDRIIKESQRQPIDHFILMFAGHGLPRDFEAQKTDAFLAPYDAMTEAHAFFSGGGSEFRNETFIDRSWLARQLTEINARSIVVILDSCYSGNKVFGDRFFANMGYSVKSFAGASGVGTVQRNLVVSAQTTTIGAKKIAYLASSREDQPSAEYDSLRHGALSYAIFQSISAAQNDVYTDDRRELLVEGIYSDITRLFKEIKVQGRPLGDVHQPFLLPLPDQAGIKEMTFLRVAGVRRREPKTGFVDIVTEPTGAEIFVNGIKRPEITSARLELTEGRHHIELYLPSTSYRHSFTVEVAPTRTVQERLILRGALRVDSFWLKDGQRSSGPALEVYLNGSRVNQGQNLASLVAGTHELRVRFQNVEKTRRIEIRPDSPLQVNYSVIRKPAPQQPRRDGGAGGVL